MSRFVAAVMLLAVGGCSGHDKTAALDALGSWTATSSMVGEAWLRGAVPDAYAARALGTAEDKVRRYVRLLSAGSDRESAEHTARALTAVHHGVEARNRAAVGEALAALRTASARFTSQERTTR